MRVVFDVLGSTERSGGMRLHSTEIIKAWTRLWPDDDVTIVGPKWAFVEFSSRTQVRVWENESAIRRSLGQLFGSWRVAHKADADVLISLSPIVSPFYRGTTVCFQHDWRHKLNPYEFPLIQRLYRRLWEISARHASFNACISGKAVEETSQLIPSSTTVLIENGWDHGRTWNVSAPTDEGGHLVTFGHHNNKRPELAIAALAELRKDRENATRLVVLGARGEYAEELRAIAEHHGVDDAVDFPGFVSENEYQRIVSTAAGVVMPSTDEGFGLPVAEALFLGIPAIVTDDSGMLEIFGDAVTTAAPEAGSLALAIQEALSNPSDGRQGSGEMTTWDSAATRLRDAIRRLGDR